MDDLLSEARACIDRSKNEYFAYSPEKDQMFRRATALALQEMVP